MAGFDCQAALSFLGSSVGQTMEVLWVEASEEKDLQVCLNQIIHQLLTSISPKAARHTMTCMLCSLNVAPFLQRWGVAGDNSVFIVAVLIMPNQACLLCSICSERR